MTGILYAEKPIAVFLTAGYEEGTAVFCLEQLRKAGLPISLVGINEQPIRGRHGIYIHPDSTLAALPPEVTFHMILIAGGRQHVGAMLTDPRVHKLLHKTIDAGGFIAPLPKIEPLLLRSGFSHNRFAPHIIKRGSMNLDEYINHLIQHSEKYTHTLLEPIPG